MSDQDLILIDDEPEEDSGSDLPPWLVLVVDDEEDVHTLTRSVVSELRFMGRDICLLHASSGRQAASVMAETSDIAVVLLDVVMETDDAGLQLVRTIREEFLNTTVRIVLRTGQPGIAPERQVILDWDINEYLPKSELTANRLFSSVVSSLRAYHHLAELNRTREELEDYQTTLEQKVLDRTESLAASNRRLEDEIQERHRIEAAIREREQDLRCLLEGSSIGITILASDGNRLFVNSRYLTLLGLEAEEARTGRPAVPEFETFGPHWLRTVLSGGRRESEMFRRKKNGETWWSLNSTETVTFEGKQAVILWCYDITQRKHAEALLRETAEQLEARLLQSRKMEAIGTLAGGIAHDFNNVLATVMGSAEMAQDYLDKEERAWRYVDNILTASYHAKNLVQQLLTFARPARTGGEPSSLAAIAGEALDLLLPTLPDGMSLDRNFQDCDSFILADATQINQVITNLCRNAIDAMQDHIQALDEQAVPVASREAPRLIVDIARVELDSMVPFGEKMLDPGAYMQLVVADNGHGMDSETASRIFDPFFSTKRAGRGTGLGLSMVHGLIAAHNGAITVTSEPGQGATFRILLPVWSSGADGRPAEALPAIPVQSEEYHILLVEDETRLLESAREQIESLGYVCETVHNAEAALDLVFNQEQSFDIIISDQVLPGMSGTSFASILKESGKAPPVILISGYEPGILARKIQEDTVAAILTKPVNRRELAMAISSALPNRKETETTAS